MSKVAVSLQKETAGGRGPAGACSTVSMVSLPDGMHILRESDRLATERDGAPVCGPPSASRTRASSLIQRLSRLDGIRSRRPAVAAFSETENRGGRFTYHHKKLSF